jgi:2'-5' RNA ligase
MSDRSSSARLFVAVDPPVEVRGALAAWARTAARRARSGSRAGHTGAGALRLLDAELLHVTVCFLGERSLQEVDAIAAELEACERPAVELSLGAPLWLPPRRPRALAVELHDERGTLAAIHAQVHGRLATDPPERTAGGEVVRSARAAGSTRRPGRRPHRFRPHVTVARMRPDNAPHKRALPPTPARAFAPPELILYRSWLSPEGASYERLSAFPLED